MSVYRRKDKQDVVYADTMKVKGESEKVALSSTFRKLRSWLLVPSLHGK